VAPARRKNLRFVDRLGGRSSPGWSRGSARLQTRTEGHDTMRFMMLVKSGVMLACEGLQASSKGARVRFRSGRANVTDGPFNEAKELIAGFWMIQVKSRDEAVEWARRVPFVDGEIEIRQVFEMSDFPRSEGLQQHVEIMKQLDHR
jgi:hypothetical protein